MVSANDGKNEDQVRFGPSQPNSSPTLTQINNRPPLPRCDVHEVGRRDRVWVP